MTSVQNGRSERVLADPARSAQLGCRTSTRRTSGISLYPRKHCSVDLSPREGALGVQRLPRNKKVRGLKLPLTFGVSDGTRTRDMQDHNLRVKMH